MNAAGFVTLGLAAVLLGCIALWEVKQGHNGVRGLVVGLMLLVGGLSLCAFGVARLLDPSPNTVQGP